MEDGYKYYWVNINSQFIGQNAMRIFPPPLVIGDEEGFTKEKDIFGRAKIGAGLTNLVSEVSDPTVIAVDGQWGSGKTTFLKMWAGELRKNGFPVIYFDAFENDYLADAFMAIAGEIILLAQEKKKAATPIGKRFVKSAVGASKVLMRSGLKLGAKAATFGAIAGSDVDDIGKDVAAELSELTDKYLGELLTKQKQEKEAIQEFRDALATLPELLSEDSGDKDDQNDAKPLILIVDELDRCKPPFALEILERIKHFFSVPNVHFILGVHLGQLNNSVTLAYGSNIDAKIYLQKFIHLVIHIIDREIYPNERTIRKYLKYLGDRLDVKDEDRQLAEDSIEFIQTIAERKNLSLRTIERIMTYLALSLAFTRHNYFRPAPIIAGLCLLKVTNPESFERAKQGYLEFDEVNSIFAFEKDDPEWHRDYWEYCTRKNASKELVQNYNRGNVQYRIRDRMDIVPLLVEQVIDRLTPNILEE